MGEAVDQETDDRNAGARRHLRSRIARPTLRPTPRAVVGGALVATAAIGVLLSQRAATAPPTTSYVVAVRSVPAGSTLTAADLGTVAAQLPADLSAVEKADADHLIGRRTRVALGQMDLVREGDVFEEGRFGETAANEVVLDLPPAAALHGVISVGDHVTILSTDADTTGTTTVASDVLVTGVQSQDEDAIGLDGGIRVRVGVPDIQTAQAVVDASIRSDVTLVLPAPGAEHPKQELEP